VLNNYNEYEYLSKCSIQDVLSIKKKEKSERKEQEKKKKRERVDN